jgi:hypothetical protein
MVFAHPFGAFGQIGQVFLVVRSHIRIDANEIHHFDLGFFLRGNPENKREY